MTIYEAFEDLINNWDKWNKDFRHKNRIWKARYLNRSGLSSQSVTESKMREMLLECGYKENWVKK
jgi:hypothetical protein